MKFNYLTFYLSFDLSYFELDRISTLFSDPKFQHEKSDLEVFTYSRIEEANQM